MRFFWQKKKPHMRPHEFLHSLMTVAGIVVIWRGIWYLLDKMDVRYFSGDHLYSALGGIVIGIVLLYWPDRDLKEIESH